MDIMMPTLRQQASPAPWLLRREKVNLAQLIAVVLAHKPDATVDEVVAQLGHWGVQVSGIVIAMWMAHRRIPRPDTAELGPTLVVKPSDDFSRIKDRQSMYWMSAT